MKVVYASSLISTKKFNTLFHQSKFVPGQQAQKYHRLLAEGFSLNGHETLTLSSLPVTRKNHKQVFFPGETEIYNGVKYRYLPVFNIPILKNFIVFIFSFFYQTINCLRDRDLVLICDVLNVSISLGAVLATRLFRKEAIGIVTDLPEMLSINEKSWFVRASHRIIKLCTRYVFLTSDMNLRLNLKEKPFVVVEGLVDIVMKGTPNDIHDKYKKDVILYAGALHKKYGIDILLDGFVDSNLPALELHLYGDGDYVPKIRQLSKKYPKIKYFGVVPNRVVVDAEIKASLLVNPRKTNEEYTRYSFPSKNMEYMSTGTPVLTTRLPGMPMEYYSFVYIIERESAEGIKRAIDEVMNKTKSERHQMGIRAKEFVLKYKNNAVSAKKIYNVLLRDKASKEGLNE
ncbi:MAG: glycosyltransferase family 4 protein [Clostridiales bacterium]|nr:glycosyltransferase family 4 protein [Clostridiales bacterium]NLM20117.1 glycosyltransferase family 4 protein [Clostridiaceae bacterium]